MSSHYTDDSDSPGWITNAQGGLTATTVYADLVAEDLSLSLINDNSGNRGELALTTPRGDVAATITLASPSAMAAGLDSWTRYTEYGAPTTAQPVGQVGAAGNGYGWLGGKQRTTTATIGLLLMGARLYNPVTGLFTSLDPVYGGNDTAYGYPNDPINKQDVSGESWAKWARRLGTLSDVASFFPGAGSVISAVSGYASAYAYHRAGDRKNMKSRLISTTVGVVAGGIGKMVGKGIARGVQSSWQTPRRAGSIARRASVSSSRSTRKIKPRRATRARPKPTPRRGRAASPAPYRKTAWAIREGYSIMGSQIGSAAHSRYNRLR